MIDVETITKEDAGEKVRKMSKDDRLRNQYRDIVWMESRGAKSSYTLRNCRVKSELRFSTVNFINH